MDWEEGKKYEKKDFRKLYEDLVKSDWFKKAYNNKSLGECPLDFPELRESEDERIRKEIIDFIQWAEERGMTRHDYHQAKRPSEWTAYLEKQKEQKHPDGCFTCGEYKKGYEEGRRNGFTAGYNKTMKEVEQEEQKPAEWSEDDADFINMLILHFNYLINKGGDSVETYKSYREKLKSLRPQTHDEIYKSAKYDLADRFMLYIDNNRPIKMRGLSDVEREDIYKAFNENDLEKIMRYIDKYRPSWKPSEEQMSMLLAVINEPNNAGSESCHLALTSLYNHLKKLM